MKSSNTTWISLIIISLGCLFLYLTKGIPFPTPNQKSGQLVGYLLTVVGLSSFFFFEKIEITFDEKKRLLRYKKKTINAIIKKQIPYKEITQFSYRKVGQPHKFIVFYFLVIELHEEDILRTGYFVFSKEKALEKIEELNQKIRIS